MQPTRLQRSNCAKALLVVAAGLLATACGDEEVTNEVISARDDPARWEFGNEVLSRDDGMKTLVEGPFIVDFVRLVPTFASGTYTVFVWVDDICRGGM